MPEVYRSFKQLGEEYIRQYPDLAGEDPEEIGRQAAPQLKDHGISVVDEYGDIDVGEALSNFPSDFMRTGKETLEGIGEAVTHPIDTASNLFNVATGGLSKAAISAGDGDEESLFTQLGRGIATDEDREMAGNFGTAVMDSVSPAAVQQRPANALATIMDAIPVGPKVGLLTSLAKKGGAAGGLAKVAAHAPKLAPSRAAESLLTAPFKAAGAAVRAAKGAAGAIGRSGRGQRVASAVGDAAKDMQVGGRGLMGEQLATILGITTGRPRQFAAQLMARVKSPEFRTIFRQARKMDEGELTSLLQKKSLEATNKLQEGASTEYATASDRFFGPDTGDVAIDMAPLQQQIRQALDEIGAVVDDAGNIDFSKSDVTRLGGSRGKLAGELQDLLRVPRAAPVPDAPVSMATGARLATPPPNPPPPNVMAASELHRRRKLIDDALSTMSPTDETSTIARHGLAQARDAVRDHLESSLGPEYSAAMGKYRDFVVLRDELSSNLGLRPGQVDKRGNIQGGLQETGARKMEGALADGGIGHRRLDALEKLENLTGTKGLVDAQLAQMSQAWAGGGLIVRNELAQFGRGVVATATAGAIGGIISPILALPAMALFSPRIMSEVILRIGDGGLIRGLSGGKARARKSIERVTSTMERLNALTGGELRRTAQREGWNVTQLLERLEVQQEDGE